MTPEPQPIPGPDLDLPEHLEEAETPSRQEMLEAIPLSVVIEPTVDLDAADPAVTGDGASDGRRVCVSTRRAGGRCLAAAPRGALLCNAHSGRLDPSAGGKARAQQLRNRGHDAEETLRLGRLGTRGVIADAFAQNPHLVRAAVVDQLQRAADGDAVAQRTVTGWLNQGLGMPTETVRTTTEVGSVADLADLTDEQLRALVEEKRGSLRLVTEPVDDDEAASA